MSVVIHDVVQGSEEWLYLRTKYVTGTDISTLLSRGRVGPKSTATFRTEWTDRGHDLEDYAISLFEKMHMVDVLRPGFVTNGKYPGGGYSPDGIADGTIEVKCFAWPRHLAIRRHNIPFEILAQVQYGMMICELPMCYLVFYNPEVEPAHQIKIFKIKADKKIHSRMAMMLETNYAYAKD